MNEDQVKWILMQLGVVDVNDPVEITRKVRCIEFNNNTAVFINPLDDINKLIEFNYEKDVICVQCDNRGYIKKQYKSFLDLEAIVGLAQKPPVGYKGGVEEFEDGSYWDYGKSPNNQDFVLDPDDNTKFKKDDNGRPIHKSSYNGTLYSNLQRLSGDI
jgi:hypothetical protein